MSDQEEEFDAESVVNASEENKDASEVISIPVPSEEFPESDQKEDNESEVEPSSGGYTTRAKEESYQSLSNVEPEDEEQLMEEALLPKQVSYSPKSSTEHYLTKYDNAMQPAKRYYDAGSLAFLDKIKAIKESLKASVKDPLATVKVVLFPVGQEIIMPFKIDMILKYLKDHFSYLLKIPSNILQISYSGMILKNNETLLKHGVKPQDIVQVEIFSTDPDLFPIKRIQGLNDASQIITVRVQTGITKYQEVAVEIIKSDFHKPFLGGFRHKITGIEYHNAGTQTVPKKNPKKDSVFCRDTQTVFQRKKLQQTTNTTSTQMTKIGVYVSNMTDKLVTPGNYFSAAEYHAQRLQAVTAMSVRLRFLSSGDAGAVGVVGRSASFAGFSSAQSRRIAKSIHGNSVRSRMPAKSSKMYGTLRKGSVCPDPKPQQVKKIFEALKRGLKEHLCVQQAELDYLSGRHKDTRRNSRLAFYYDLDKQTRSVERHIRKMEFHISKVDELYEGYCIQCRLRDGASNMQRAFSRCPPSRASRESLQELGRSLQECLEDMWLIEGALEVHLGEFHIRMKGLVGYARLCPGDQYEVLMRLGRQRWKLKGRIESDDSQTWEEEEKAFIPTLHENFEIKVTELRGLSSLAVGTVTCDIADFFTTRPQVIVVDVTELGTIKLQLEVLWNPFDTDSFLMSPSPTGKFSMGSRKGSLYNWTPPSTPSFRERYYLSVLQQPTQQTLLLGGPRATSILSYLSDNDLRGPGLRSQSQELPEMDSFSSEDPRDTETSTSASTLDMGFLPLAIGPNASIEEEAQGAPQPLPEMAHLAGGAFEEQPGWRNLGRAGSDLPGESPVHDHTAPGSRKDHDEGETEDRVDGPEVTLERPLQEVLELLRSEEPAQPQLRELEYQVLGFRDRLKPRGAPREHASAESLMECILESFAFLNADLAPQELSLFGGCQGPRKDRSPPPPRKASSRELTAGTPELDRLLTVHLQVCKALLQKLASPNLSRMVQESLLEEAAQQKQVLEMLSVLDFEKVSKATSIEEIVPQAARRKGCLKLWTGCTEPGRVLSCAASTLLNQLKKTFLHRVRGKYPGQLEIACRRLLEQVVSCGGLLPGAGPPEEQTVTWFQFHSYLQRQSVSDLEKHFARLTKEVTLVEQLQCAGQGKAVRKLQGKRLGQLQPLPQTLRAWALLQLDGPPRVCRAASARLAGAARNKSFREKALLFYTNALTENDAKLQQAACVALKHLRGIESIDQIASLCQSDLEAVRTAAREATLSFGEKGRLAFERMDKLYLEQREEAFCQEADIEITIF